MFPNNLARSALVSTIPYGLLERLLFFFFFIYLNFAKCRVAGACFSSRKRDLLNTKGNDNAFYPFLSIQNRRHHLEAGHLLEVGDRGKRQTFLLLFDCLAFFFLQIIVSFQEFK